MSVNSARAFSLCQKVNSLNTCGRWCVKINKSTFFSIWSCLTVVAFKVSCFSVLLMLFSPTCSQIGWLFISHQNATFQWHSSSVSCFCRLGTKGAFQVDRAGVKSHLTLVWCVEKKLVCLKHLEVFPSFMVLFLLLFGDLGFFKPNYLWICFTSWNWKLCCDH